MHLETFGPKLYATVQTGLHDGTAKGRAESLVSTAFRQLDHE